MALVRPPGDGMNRRAQLLLISGLLLTFTILTISFSISHSVGLGRHHGERHDLTPSVTMVDQHFPSALEAELAGLHDHTGDSQSTLAATFNRTAEFFEGRFAAHGQVLALELNTTTSLDDDRYNLTYRLTISDGVQTVSFDRWLVVSMTAGDPWWNDDYHYRVRLEATIPWADQRVPLTLPLNFTPLLDTLEAERLEPTALRVVAQQGGEFTPLATGFAPDAGFDDRTAAAGTLAWTTSGDPDDRYYCYFDHGAHPVPNSDLHWNGSVVENEQLRWEPLNNTLFEHRTTGSLEMSVGGYYLDGGNGTSFTSLSAEESRGMVRLNLSSPTLNRTLTIFSGTGLVAIEDDSDAWTGIGTINFTTLKTGTSGLRYAMLERTGTRLAYFGTDLQYQLTDDGATRTLLVRGAEYLYLTGEDHDDVRKMGLNLAGASVTVGTSHRLPPA